MKKLLLTAFIATLAMVNVQANTAEVKMCKTFIEKAKTYKSTMKEDKVSQATLAFYKDEVVGHCGNIAAKMPYKKNFFAAELMKNNYATVNDCKLSIKMAKSYADSEDKSFIITHAHKVNVVDNCGPLIAKKAPAFCLFDVIDEPKEDIKARCIATIKKAHAFTATINTNPEALQSHKDAVIANCGTLQATI